MASLVEVVEALKKTPKGQLSYSSALSSPQQQLAFIDSLSSPPGIQISDPLVQKYTKPCPAAPPSPFTLSTLSNSTEKPGDGKEESLLVTPPPSHSLSHSPPSLEPAMDIDGLSDDETREIMECIKRRKAYFMAEMASIHSKHKQSATEREERLKMAKEDAIFQRKIEDHFIMQEADREVERVRLKYQEHSEYTEKQIQDNHERMKIQLLKIQKERKELLDMLEGDTLRLKVKANGLLEKCRFQQLLDNNIAVQFNQESEAVLHSIQEQKLIETPEPQMLNKIKLSLTALLPFLLRIKDEVERANKAGDEILERQRKQKMEEEEAERKRLEELQKAQTVPAAPVDNDKVSTTAGTNIANGMIIPKGALQRYEELITVLEKANTQTADFSKTSDPQMKKYKSGLMRAVNMVCAVAGQSGSQLLNFVQQMKRLFSGDSIQVSGKRVTVKDHPLARNYCINLLARKIVEQAGEASSNVFVSAAVAVLVWNDFPEFGDLFLAHCYHNCPVLVPLYFIKTEGTSDIEYKMLLGYKVVNGVLEKEELFRDRMSGFVKLYAAVTQTKPIMRLPNPHGLENGWTLIARILNTEPQHNITAITLRSLLEVAGHALMVRFGRQFKKIMFYLCQEYIKKIESVTASGERLAYVELELLLERCVKEGGIPEPKGTLSDEFWRCREVAVVDANLI